jgi:glycine hydroxymethyltransferase
MNRLPYDPYSARVTSGMRLGTPIVTRNGMGQVEMEQIATLVDRILTQVEILGARQYRLPSSLRTETQQRVQYLCARFPIA